MKNQNSFHVNRSTKMVGFEKSLLRFFFDFFGTFFLANYKCNKDDFFRKVRPCWGILKKQKQIRSDKRWGSEIKCALFGS